MTNIAQHFNQKTLDQTVLGGGVEQPKRVNDVNNMITIQKKISGKAISSSQSF
jgi:hypothetical protein